MSVPYTFASATTSIPLSQLDTNFNTPITIGNTAVLLGGTITTAYNMTFANVIITSVGSTFPNNYLANSNVVIGTTTIPLGNTASSLSNVSLANVTINSVTTPITPSQGGTGLTSLTTNNVVLGNGTNNVQLVAPGTSGNVLVSNGTTWISNVVTTNVSSVTGTLSVANGGTGQTTYTNGQLLIGNSTGNTLTKATLTAGTNITITNGAGSITINSAAGAASTPIATDISGTDYTLTLPSAINASVTQFPNMTPIALDATKELMLIYGASSLQAVVWDSSSSTFGTTVLVRSGTFTNMNTVAAVLLSSTSVLVSSLATSGTALETVVLSISGSTITVNTAVATTLGATSTLIAANTRFVTCGTSYILNYYDVTTSQPRFRAITVSGTTPTLGSELVYAGGTAYHTTYALSSSVFLSLSVSNTFVYAYPVSVSGTTLTGGTAASTAATSNTALVSGLLSTNNVAISYFSTSTTNCSCAVVSVAATVASISVAATTLTASSAAPGLGMQIFSNQAFINAGRGATSQLSVLTDTAGVATVGTPVTPVSASLGGYLSTGKVLLVSSLGAYQQYGISSGAPVLEKTFQGVYIAASDMSGLSVYYTSPLSGPPNQLSQGTTTTSLRLSSGKFCQISTPGNGFTLTFDGTSIAKWQQAAWTVASTSGAYPDALSTATGWGIAPPLSTTATSLVLRKIVLS